MEAFWKKPCSSLATRCTIGVVDRGCCAIASSCSSASGVDCSTFTWPRPSNHGSAGSARGDAAARYVRRVRPRKVQRGASGRLGATSGKQARQSYDHGARDPHPGPATTSTAPPPADCSLPLNRAAVATRVATRVPPPQAQVEQSCTARGERGSRLTSGRRRARTRCRRCVLRLQWG